MLVVVFGAVTFWLTSKTYKGRNWARWALLLYLVFGWWLGAEQLPEDFQNAPIAALIGVGCMGMEIVAAFHLFLGKGAKWFRLLGAARTRGPSSEA